MSKLSTDTPLGMGAPWGYVPAPDSPKQEIADMAAAMDSELVLLYVTAGDGGLACMHPPTQWMLDQLAAGRSVLAAE
jgi:hypothetical protein